MCRGLIKRLNKETFFSSLLCPSYWLHQAAWKNGCSNSRQNIKILEHSGGRRKNLMVQRKFQKTFNHNSLPSSGSYAHFSASPWHVEEDSPQASHKGRVRSRWWWHKRGVHYCPTGQRWGIPAWALTNKHWPGQESYKSMLAMFQVSHFTRNVKWAFDAFSLGSVMEEAI